MPSGRFISYTRVSTARQGRSGLGLDAQREAVRTYLNGGSWSLIAEVTEVESGRRSDRPRLAEALRLCRIHNATLVIAKLDRLARNVAFISALMESGVEFVACDFPQANRLTVHILAAVAEHEAKAISDRTKAALAAAKARGTKLGRSKGDGNTMTDAYREKAAAAVKAKADAKAQDLSDVIAHLKAEGASSLRELAAGLNGLGITTSRGGTWSAVQVSRVLARQA